MGWVTIPEPGTKYGPCRVACDHRDCKANREDAESSCVLCRKPIGYEVKMFSTRDGTRRLVHALCEWTQVEREQVGGGS